MSAHIFGIGALIFKILFIFRLLLEKDHSAINFPRNLKRTDKKKKNEYVKKKLIYFEGVSNYLKCLSRHIVNNSIYHHLLRVKINLI